MALTVTHAKVSVVADDAAAAAAGEVLPSEWNANHTLTGTASAAQLNSSVVQSIVNDTNVTGSISAQALTLGWAGKLASSRLDLTMSPTWTGNHTFNPTSGDSITVNTASSSLARGLIINQSGHGSWTGTANGSASFNKIILSADDTVWTNSLPVCALEIDHTFGGANAQGARYSLLVRTTYTGSPNAGDPDTDTVAGGFVTYATAAQGAVARSLFALNPSVVVTAAATGYTAAVGAEVDMNCAAAVNELIGWTILTSNTVAATTRSVAYMIGNVSGGAGWDYALALSNRHGGFPMRSTGTIIGSVTGGTVANGIDFSNCTITGNSLNFPNFSVTGAGAVSGASLNATTSTATTGGIKIAGVPTITADSHYTYISDPAGANKLFFGTTAFDPTVYFGPSGSYIQANAGRTYIASGIAIPAGGASTTGIVFSSTASFGLFYGSGAPTLSVAKGSIYLRSDGGALSRFYVNTNGTTGYSALPVSTDVALVRFTLTAVNFNSANSDNAVTIPLPAGVSRWRMDSVIITNASASVSTATAGVFTGAGATGQTIAATQALTVTATAADTNNNTQALTLTNATTMAYNDTSIFFRITTPQGSAATADVTFVIFLLT